MGEDAILERLRAILNTPKAAIGELGWTADKQHANVIRCPIVCQCADPQLTGVELRGTSFIDRPNEHVGFQLLADIRGETYRITRVDWRPRAPHTNKKGTSDIKGTTVWTSIHHFERNAALGLSVMQNNNLPIALPIEPEPDDFEALLRYIGDTLSLTNAHEIPVPRWSKSLLP